MDRNFRMNVGAMIVALSCVLALGVAAPSPAVAGSTTLCSTMGGCQSAGRSTFGWESNFRNSYWGAYAGHNCTNYVAYRLITTNGMSASGSEGNASTWGIKHAGITNSSPARGSVAWWNSSAGLGSAGHVAYVEDVLADGSIVLSEDSWDLHTDTGNVDHFAWVKRTAGAGWPTGFIHFKDMSSGGLEGRVPWIGAVDNARSLRLLHWTGSTWQNDNFSQTVAVRSQPSVYLSAEGHPFIGWVDGTGSLRLSHWTGSTWQNDNFSQGVLAGTSPSAFNGPGGNPFISWVDNTGSLRLSHWTGSTWQHDNFGQGVRAGTSPSAYLGQGDTLWIGWVDNTGSLRLSHWTGSTWQNDNFSQGVLAGTSPSAFNGPGGNPFISWVDNTGSLRLSHWTGSTWQHDNFGQGVRAGTSPSAYLGQGDTLWIGWVDNTGSLRLSHWTGSTWQNDNFNQGVLAETSPIASLGPNGYPFISWVDPTATLRLSHWTGSAWQHDNFGMVVHTPAIVNDSAPSVTGTAKVGSTLSATPGKWTPNDGSFGYQWLINDQPVSGATSRAYTISAADAGKTVRVRVTASKAGYTATSSLSSGLLVAPPDTNPGDQPPPPPAPGGGGGTSAAPTAVTAAKVAFPGKRTAVLTWTAIPNATSYRVQVSKKNTRNKWTAPKAVTAPSIRLTRLKKRATYRVRITALGPGGTGPTSTWTFRQKK